MMSRAAKLAVSLGITAAVVCLVSSQLMCRDPSDRSREAQGSGAPSASTTAPDATVTAIAATTLPAGPTSVRVSISMVVQKKYGLLAHVVGKRDVTVTEKEYSPDRSWWENPMVIHQDSSFPNSKVTADANSAAITGSGKSANVSIELTLVPHADVTLKTVAASDCIKGQITATITAISEYYDGVWTRMADAKDSPVTFDFDTADKSRALRPTTAETRAVPPFSLERYTRAHEKWEPKSAWPTAPKGGDWRCTIYVKDVKLTMTGYEYAQPAATAPVPHPATASEKPAN